MGPETELLWPGAALLLLVGAAAGLCVRCSRPGKKGRGRWAGGRGGVPRPGCHQKGQPDKAQEAEGKPRGPTPKLPEGSGSGSLWALVLLGQGPVSRADKWNKGREAGGHNTAPAFMLCSPT